MTVARLEDLVSVKGRFARSVRSDKDTGQAAQLDGYLPTARGLEVVRRVVNAMERDTGRAFSITGPYGSGKSSLAVFLDALLGRTDDAAHQTAVALLKEHDAATAARLADARSSMGAGSDGFVRAVITAPQREPITTTVLRALSRGAKRARVTTKLRNDIEGSLDRATSDRYASPSYHEVRELLGRLSALKPVLLIIDEFGKNLEAFASGGADGDLYLLQELAEWASGDDSLPLVLVTIQHLAFEAYAADTTATQRREWAKVQGRFEDISYVDTAAATRGLIRAALDHADDPRYQELRDTAAAEAAEAADVAGVPGVAAAGLLAACYPLHPTTLLVLPPLCARYGQNERTLFSFLASSEPQSVMSFLADTELTKELPWVRLDRVYDYFVESASTFVGASPDASRWMEVETTIRDAHGLTGAQFRVLKSVGALNLVAASGSVRASTELVAFAMADGTDGLKSEDDVRARLAELAGLGLLTYRDFASEYRIWQGSDFDIASALVSARRQARAGSLAAELSRVMRLRPVVAARHSIRRNTTRAFARAFADDKSGTVPPPKPGDVRDGTLLYALDHDLSVDASAHKAMPVVVVEPSRERLDALVDATVEVAALLSLLDDPTLATTDRAARRELNERLAVTRQQLERAVDSAYGVEGTWRWLNPPAGETRELKPHRGSDALSDVLDEVYADAPEVHYEAINRAQLTSQGAKARRILLEAVLTPSLQGEDRLGLDGDGPEVGMYRAVLEDSGVHIPGEGFTASNLHEEWQPAWRHLEEVLLSAKKHAVSIEHVLDEIMRPPYGLRHGVATVLLTAALVRHAQDLAIYEHGTFKPRLDAALSERMVRNPANFAVKHLAASNRNSKRSRAVQALCDELSDAFGLPKTVRATVLTTVMLALRPFHMRPTNFARRTRLFSAAWGSSEPIAQPSRVERTRAVRDALTSTQEPDVLLFEALPAALGMGPLPASGNAAGSMTADEIDGFAAAAASYIKAVDDVYEKLCHHILDEVLHASQARDTTTLAGRAAHLDDVQVVSSHVRTFAGLARMADSVDATSFAQQVATSVTGTPPSEWSDSDIPGHLARIRETASSFRRVAALAQARRGQPGGESFDALAIDITSTDGRHQPEVVAVQTSERAALADGVTALLHTAGEHLGDEQAGARALLALIAERVLNGTPSADNENTTMGKKRHED